MRAGSLTDPKNLILWHAVLSQAVTFSTRPTVTYEAMDAGVSPAHLGLVGAAFAIAPLVLALPSGRLVDRHGDKPGLIVGSGLMLVATGILILGRPHVAALILATLLLGAAHLQCAVAQQARVASTTTGGGLDQAFGVYTFAASLGQMVGPGVVAWFGRGKVSPDTTGVLVVALFFGLALLALALAMPNARPARTDVGLPTTSAVELLRTPGLKSALVSSAVVLAAVDLLLIYLPLLGTERGWTGFTVGWLLALRGLASMVSRLLLGRLTRSLGRRRLMLWSMSWTAITLACLPAPLPVPVTAFIMLAAGFALGAVQPLTMSWLAERAPSGQRGLAMSLRLMGNRVGQLVVPASAGALAAGSGASGVLWLSSVTIALATIAVTRTRLD